MTPLLNGRVPLDWELPAIERGRQCELARDLTMLAGLLGVARPEPGGYATVLLPTPGTP